MPQKTLYQVEVAPLTVLPLSRSPFFSYLSVNAVLVGSLVRIPFGRQTLSGIVFSSKPLKVNRPPHWMKSIVSVEKVATLTSSQLALAQFLATTYFTPLGKCLKYFLPPTIKRQSKALSDTHGIHYTSPTSAEEILLKKILVKSSRPQLLKASLETIQLLIRHYATLKKNEQLLILVPEHFLVLWWEKEIGSLPSLTFVHSGLKKSELANAWSSIRENRTRIIFGTRQALFAPFQKLSHIIMLDEEDETSYKQWEMSPRYSARDCLMELSHFHKATLFFASPTPSLESYVALDEKSIGLKSLGPKKKHVLPTVNLINMRFDKKKRGQRVLTPELRLAMATTLQRKEKVLLLGKQQGLTHFSLCTNCRTALRCPQCQRALLGDQSGYFYCAHCGYQSSLFPHCQNCNHQTFESFGAGTQKIEREVAASFASARILRFDRSIIKKKDAFSETISRLFLGEYDILVGTYSLLKVPRLLKTSLIAMIEADSALAYPDYRGEERLSRDIVRSELLLGQREGGQLLLQTFQPELTIFSQWSHETFDATARDFLLPLRTVLGYPPYFHYLKIEAPGKNREGSLLEATRLAQELQVLIIEHALPYTLVPPHLPLSKPKQKNYQFFLKFPRTATLAQPIMLWLFRSSRTAFYEIDPLTLN